MSAVRKTIEYRAKNAALLALAKELKPHPMNAKIREYLVSAYHEHSLLGEPLFIVRAGLSLPRSLMDAVPYEAVLEWLMFEKEVVFLRCDKATRETRKIVKMLAVVDLQNTTLGQSMDGRFGKVQGESGKLSEIYYPQASGSAVHFFPALSAPSSPHPVIPL